MKRCNSCGVKQDHWGICMGCTIKAETTAIAERVAPALASVPAAYDARWGQAELLRRVPGLAAERPPPRVFFERPVLLLHGESGAGKSSLAAALFCFAVQSVGPGAGQSKIDYAASARWVWARDVPGDGAAVARHASLLVIDDVGQEAGQGDSFTSQDRCRAMADTLDHLYTHRVFGQTRGRVILTTYGTPETWRKLYGAGVARRYWEDAEHVQLWKLERA